MKQRIPDDPRNLSWADGLSIHYALINSLTVDLQTLLDLDPTISRNLDGMHLKVLVLPGMGERHISRCPINLTC